MRRRIFNIMQYDENPKTGETLITEEQIQKGLRHRAFKDWAYIHHTRDVYTEANKQMNPDCVPGSPKPPHWHIVIRCSNAVDHTKVAEWFGIEPQYVDCPPGRYAFEDCLAYMTHDDEKQQKLGKTVYDVSEVKASYGFDYEKTVSDYLENRLKFGQNLSRTEQMLYEVLFEGKKPEQVAKEYQYEYLLNVDRVEKYRRKYIANYQKMPSYRINIYVEGAGGQGKSVLCRWLAQSLMNRDGTLDDDETYFLVGGKGASLEGYDGQPCIIWDDCRAVDLIDRLGSRDEVFKVFDTSPQNQRENVKYSSIRLCNSVNIVNSVQPWREFVDCLSGEYKDKFGREYKAEDKNQVRRRFPIFIIIHEDDYDMVLNRGVYEETREYEQYLDIKRVSGSVRKIVQAIPPENKMLISETTQKLVAPVVEDVDKLKGILDKDETMTEEEWSERYSDVGSVTIIPQVDPKQESMLDELTTPRDDDIPFDDDDCPFD